MQISKIIQHIESLAPLAYQESYDNAGLLIGNASDEISMGLITLDITESVMDEAIRSGSDLIIAHHPLIFNGLKKLNGKNEVERCVIKAIKNNIAIYIAHTNLDSVPDGVNSKICEKIGLQNCKILAPSQGQLRKLVTFIPQKEAKKVQQAIFNAGAGQIGNYDSCGYASTGIGSFRGNENSNPFIGTKGELHHEHEIRFETIFPQHLQKQIMAALLASHPYEEVAYDIYPLENQLLTVGMGMIGELASSLDEIEFLRLVKNKFNANVVRHSPFRSKKITKVAVCGGSGSSLIRQAIAANADVLLTGDLKYHQFFEAEGQILLADIGHFESEQFTKEVFYELLTKKIPKFAVRLSEVNTNPVNYLV